MERGSAELEEVLRTKFGRSEFRANQLDIIKATLEPKDALVVLPTGHGKSLTFQLPAVVQSRSGFYIVVSPLLALMKDQVRQLQALGLGAASVNSTTTSRERQRIFDEFAAGSACLLYVSPEQCLTAGFRAFLDRVPKGSVKRIVVDEAHCAVEWGTDFRPDYARLGSEFRRVLGPGVPFTALTGTASPQMQTQICRTLGLQTPHVFTGSTSRPHLHFEVRYVEDVGDRLADMLKFLRMYRGRIARLSQQVSDTGYVGCGIIYCRSRASTEYIAAECNRELGQFAAAYHAGMPAAEREAVMARWLAGERECAVVVATIAFGLGIDKPDTRFVIHFDLPENMEAYAQQTGRAGRDRRAARCILYYALQESNRSMRFVRGGSKDAVRATTALLSYATTTNKCRHAMLASYFGDPAKPHCDFACDFCKMPKRLKQRYDAWFSEVA